MDTMTMLMIVVAGMDMATSMFSVMLKMRWHDGEHDEEDEHDRHEDG